MISRLKSSHVIMNNRLPIKLELPEGFLQEETRCNYIVSAKMKAVWAVQLDLYIELKRVCDKYQLTLLGDGGTVLGAVRHGGFIPWDDDMDLMMPREDYDKLCAIASEEFSYPYFWKTEETDPGCLRGHAQLTNSETTAILDWEKDTLSHTNKGIFIDVFPYDNVPDDVAERASYIERIVELKNRASKYAAWFYGENRSKGFKKLIKSFLLPLFKAVNKQYCNNYYKKMEILRHKYNKTLTSDWSNLAVINSTHGERFIQRKSWYEKLQKVQFEFLDIEIPGEYDAYLQNVYGDWHKMVQGTSLHGSVYFDPYTPYGLKTRRYVDEES